MGGTISTLFWRLFSKQEIPILMLGLDNAGKTTILYKLKLGKVLSTIPTIVCNIESITHKNINFIVSDITGCAVPALGRHFYHYTRAVIFVVDSSDVERIGEAESTLKNVIEDVLLEKAILLVLGNKQDKPNAMTSNEITDKLKLNEVVDHRWHLQMTSATLGNGLTEALDWLTSEIVK